MTKRVVVIEGDDASPEAVRPTVALVDRLGLDLKWVRPPVGAAAIEAGLPPFSDEAKDAIDTSDATLFGATSDQSVQALLYLRWGKQTYANVRPARYLRGSSWPAAEPTSAGGRATSPRQRSTTCSFAPTDCFGRFVSAWPAAPV